MQTATFKIGLFCVGLDAYWQQFDGTAMAGEWLAFCSACPVPRIANVFNRTGILFRQVTGMLHNNDECWSGISEWIEAFGSMVATANES